MLSGGQAWMRGRDHSGVRGARFWAPRAGSAISDPANSSTPVATLPLKRFDIPAGPLDTALDAYKQASGIALRIDIPQATLAGFQTKGIKRLYRPEEAIRILLEGTGHESQGVTSGRPAPAHHRRRPQAS